MSNLSSTPAEILDRICSYISSPKDLLYVALAARKFNQVIIPDHIQFRNIRCDFRRKNVWQKLAAAPAKAARFVEVEIVDERGTDGYHDPRGLPIIFPRSLDTSSDTEGTEGYTSAVATLASALRLMSNLRAFHWYTAAVRPTNEVFLALREASSPVESIEVLNYDDGLETSIRTVELERSPLWKFTDLTKFSFTEHHNDAELQAYITYTNEMADMLIHRCPNLEDLQLYQNHHYHSVLPEEIVQYIFLNGRWPALRRATVEGDPLDIAVIDAFFAHHPRLERVMVLERDLPARVFSYLTNLKSLSVRWTKDLAAGDHKPFEQLTTLSLDLPDHVSGEVCKGLGRILRSIPSLCHLTLHHATYTQELLLSVQEHAPNLTRLALRWDPHEMYIDSVNDWDSNCGYWQKFVSRFSQLTHLAFVDPCLWEEADESSEGNSDDGDDDASEATSDATDRCLRALTAASPHLVYVGIATDDDTEREWVAIERTAGGVYAGYHKVLNAYRVREVSWGDWYLGAMDGHLDKKEW
ncbi:hypothetical protein HGRIS_013415 [Hohenbuehelia grisea]|uniref:F-box domain-containing protein n=1 Tax=Hohenbuehelia grisea TaxID=104357 RepID=A0ABR3IVD3_9AGAR